MFRKFVSIVAAMFLMTSLCVSAPLNVSAATQEGFTYVADFAAEAADLESNSFSGNVGDNPTHVVKINSNSNSISGTKADYHSDGDYIDTNGNELQFFFGSPITSDITFGFKAKMGNAGYAVNNTYGTLSVKQHVEMDVDNDGTADNFAAHDNVANRRYLLRNYYGDKKITFYTNSESAADTVETEDVCVSDDSWNDIRVEVDFTDDSSTDIKYVIKAYINNTIKTTLYIPKTIAIAKTTVSDTTLAAGTDVSVIGPDYFNFSTGADTLIKDVYGFSGIHSSQIVPDSLSDSAEGVNTELMNENFTGGKKNDTALGVGNDTGMTGSSTIDYSNGYAKHTYTKGQSKEAGRTVFRIGSVKQTGNSFVFEAKYMFEEFNVAKALIQFNMPYDSESRWSSKLLQTVSSDGNATTLNVYNKSTVIDSCSISTNEWYNVRIVCKMGELTTEADGESYANVSYKITVDDSNGNNLISAYLPMDNNIRAGSHTVRWQIALGATATDLDTLSSGETASICVDDIYFSSLSGDKYSNSVKVDDIKLFQGQKVLTLDDAFSVGSNIKVSALVSNYTDDDGSARFIIAQYTAKNELIAINPLNVELDAAPIPSSKEAPATQSVSACITPADGVSYIRLFVIDSIGSMNPVSQSVSVSAAQ